MENEETIKNLKKFTEELLNKLKNLDINAQDTLQLALKVPGIKIDRTSFLTKELKVYYPKETIDVAISKNPAYAGIEVETVNKIANQVINYETNKVSAISFASGLPGGAAMAATIPADITQFFMFLVRTMQKLAYLYGFSEFEFNEDGINDDTMNEMLIFLGVMFGVQEANIGIKILSEAIVKKIVRTLPRKALTKGIVYPIVKKIALQVGLEMNKQIFSKGVSKIVPVVGGVVTGGLTYATFKPCCIKLKKNFSTLPISNPNTYKNEFLS